MLSFLLFVVCIAGLELLHYVERKKFYELLLGKKVEIPKARKSFVVTRMNEKLKDALYGDK